MGLNITVLASDKSVESQWARQLRAMIDGLVPARVGTASGARDAGSFGQVVFVDAAMDGLARALEKIDRKGRAVFLLVEEEDARSRKLLGQWSAWIGEGRIDDVLISPFRALEILSKLRLYHQLMMWDEVSELNSSVSELIPGLQQDLKLAERLQKSKMPVRFPEVKGFRVAHRYLAGTRAGGDYFDLAEASGGSQLSVVLTDASSYGLSSAVLTVLMRVAMKLSSDEARSCEETVRRIRSEILLTLGEKDRLSLFYGVISRKDYRLRYINRGSAAAFYADRGQGFSQLPSQGGAIARGSRDATAGAQGEVELKPEGRLILVSDGFVDSAGGVKGTIEALNRLRDAEAPDLLNELVFLAKSKLSGPDDMPERDCTAALFDVDARILRKV